MFKKFSIIFLSLITCCFAQEEGNQEIRVQLSTESSLTPLYLGKMRTEKCLFDASYIAQLEAILRFDLGYNGYTKVVNQSESGENTLNSGDCTLAFDGVTWKKSGVAYVVKATLMEKNLSLYLFSVASSSLKHFKDIALTGSLAQDRRQIHKTADTIHKTLFKTAPVASSCILYSLQVKNPKPDGSEWVSEIWECDWDGANARQVTKEHSYSLTPVFLPANHAPTDRFIYVSYKHGQPKIYIASIKEGIGKRLVDLRGNQLLPAISARRDKLAFISDASGRTDLFLQPFHPESGEMGTPVQLFSYPRSTQASPTFSPDGSKIAFVSDKDGPPRIYTIPAVLGENRANPVMITKQNKESSCPAWSPDGTKLAYSARTNAVRQIWIYDFSTQEERQLTAGPGNKENPAWAPDSLHLVFNSTDHSSSELYLVNLNQPEAIKITQTPGKKHYPTWGTR